ncbi:hypothetical protein [Variovorax paradoxus]|uniref:hypothetical protein n=1 Tax=Variovorax paradoxus TaxID=34073 RepID=UPI0019331EBC|nr:hypothetical protein INQ48_18245 [Variovorax paradoxus]
MGNFFHPMTEQASRTLRQCICCAYAIEKGERYCKQSGVWEGDYCTNHYHTACWAALLEEGAAFEFTPGEGDPPEGSRSMADARAALKSTSPDGGSHG